MCRLMFIETSLRRFAFDGPFVFEDLADVVHFLLAQIAHFLVKIDSRAEQQGTFERVRTDAVDIGEPDFDSLSSAVNPLQRTCH